MLPVKYVFALCDFLIEHELKVFLQEEQVRILQEKVD